MRARIHRLFTLSLMGLVLVGLTLAGVSNARVMTPREEVRSRRIIVYEDSTSLADRDRIVSAVRGERVKRMTRAFQADVVYLTEREANDFRAHHGVKRVDIDAQVAALGVIERRDHSADVLRSRRERQPRESNPTPPPPPPSPTPPPEEVAPPPAPPTPTAQSVPWGIDRIDAERVWPSSLTGNTVKVGVVDTGIDLDHADLVANIKGNANMINPSWSADDDNGHGTHVAGVIGAINNTFGVVGAAPDVDLYAIKVLDSRGAGYISDVIEGMDWAVANGMDVINMSLGTSLDVVSLREAVARAHSAGVITIVAAGNSGGGVLYPAAYPEAIAISAVGDSNTLASWSSRGSSLDFTAPGVDIYSTYRGDAYATLSGTSMASPHVAGTVALVLGTSVGSYDANGNGTWDQSEVVSKLRDTATDLGSSGFDTLYGWGLVNAYHATR